MIDVRCSHCGRLLRVAEEAGGRQARCPQCGGVTSVPRLPSIAAGFPMGMGGASTHLRPHRGKMILVFGILGIIGFACGVFGPVAWILGARDLKAMRSGHMDPSGESQTQVGVTLGTVSTVLICMGILSFGIMVIYIFATLPQGP